MRILRFAFAASLFLSAFLLVSSPADAASGTLTCRDTVHDGAGSHPACYGAWTEDCRVAGKTWPMYCHKLCFAANYDAPAPDTFIYQGGCVPWLGIVTDS